MISLSDLERFLAPIRRKLFLFVGKALLTAVNNEGAVGYYDPGSRSNPQRISTDWLGQLTDLERPQHYGIETYPIKGTAENIIVCPEGSRSNAFVLMVQDDGYRPTDGQEGDTIFYGKNDITSGEKHRVHFKNDGSIEVWAGATNKIIIAKDGDIDIEAKTDCNITIGGNAKIDVTGSADIDIGGDGVIDVVGKIDCTVPTFNLVGALNVTENITCEKDVLSDNAVSPVSLTNHLHLGNLQFNTLKPLPSASPGVPIPGTQPDGTSGDIDMQGKDMLNLKTLSTPKAFSTHIHTDSVPGPTTAPT